MMNCVKVTHLGFGSLDSPIRASVGIFWDLDNKPPKSFPPFDAATKLKKARHLLEKSGVVKVEDPYICRVCGRRFYTNEKLVNHFKKMDKYKGAVRDVLTPKVGYGLHLVDVMDKRMARLRCLKTVVVGDSNDGALKRTADAAFSWQEIMMGKAKKEAVSVVGRWKDRDVLKRLEWTYDPEVEKKLYYSEVESDDSDGIFSGEDKEDVDASISKEDAHAWWKLDSRSGHD
uniref:C2H2-type domain-containing protein n=1 Tax=Solanum lycopersicum TaxID=4081 RepID=A0A3Q7JHR4_SOLLC